jgi:hypothetical protein
MQDLRRSLEFSFGYKWIENIDVWWPAFEVLVVNASRRLNGGIEGCVTIGKEGER